MINTLFNTLDQVETIQGIEAIVRKSALNTCCPKYRSGCLCRLRQGGELISGLRAIACWREVAPSATISTCTWSPASAWQAIVPPQPSTSSSGWAAMTITVLPKSLSKPSIIYRTIYEGSCRPPPSPNPVGHQYRQPTSNLKH